MGDRYRIMTHVVDDFLRSSVRLCESLFPKAHTLRPTLTPCVAEDHKGAPAALVQEVSGARLARSGFHRILENAHAVVFSSRLGGSTNGVCRQPARDGAAGIEYQANCCRKSGSPI